MENSIKKGIKKSLNMSSNQYNEYPTSTDWHGSLVNGQEDNLEEIHYFFVMFHQKRKRIIEKLERVKHIAQVTDKKNKKGKARGNSAKRRKGKLLFFAFLYF